MLSAPSVTTKSGQRAVIEIVREFRYPTQFQPPQIPQTVGSFSGPVYRVALIPVGNSGTTPVTPTTPTAFETRNTGVTLEVEPVVGPDGVTIDLNLVPQVVEFEGFINYGSPILSPSSSFLSTMTGGIITSPASVITPNVINQPIFSTRKVTTSVSVYDGSTVVLGGLMREDVQKTEDRTPIIGDIPLVGRLFRTNADQHIKRNLVIFVTAHLVTPAGTPSQLNRRGRGVDPATSVTRSADVQEVTFRKRVSRMNVDKGVNRSYASTYLKFALVCLATVFLSDIGYAATNLLVGALRQDVILEFSSTDDIIFTETTFATISNPETMVFDSSGNLFVANGKANEIKKIAPSGVKTTIATDLDVDGMAVDASGNLFVSRKSENTNASDGVILKFTPDGREQRL